VYKENGTQILIPIRTEHPIHFSLSHVVFTRDGCTGRYCRARISYGDSVRPSVCPSVCPGVTTRYRIKPRSDRDTEFSPYNS